MSNIGKLKIKLPPFKKEKAWQIVPSGIQDIFLWVPFSVITGYDPYTMIIKIETWWLDKNNIKYQL